MGLLAHARLAHALFAASAVGCIVEVPDEPHVLDPCDIVTCSVNGYCDDGVCHCAPHHVGNPDAIHGCQPIGTHSPCATTCGLNAFCDAGECRCEDGFAAVCGTGDCLSLARLCDGAADCTNGADEDPLVCYDGAVQTWSVVDACDDGQDIRWRVWSQDRDWVWPSVDAVFETRGRELTSTEPIECLTDELLCFGGGAGELQWGIGLDGTGSCEDCCRTCASDIVEIGALTCD